MTEKTNYNPLEELRSQEAESTPELKKIREQIWKNTEDYEIKKWDTVAGIAKQRWISYTDLIDLNILLWKQFTFRWKNQSNILIKQWETIKIPKDIKEFNSNLEKIKEISRVLNLNRQVLSRDTKWIKNELSWGLFSRRIQSIWLPKVLWGFINAQRLQIDPRLPRIVDSWREVHVTCANLIRTLMAQSVNIWDLKPEEKKFLQKQNVDAWMLPEELMKIWFLQKHNLMWEFDSTRIWDIDPLKQDQKKQYDAKILELWKYLEKSWVAWSLVPYYFIHSNYKWRTWEYNRWRADKHYNTHQSMFAWNINLQLNAYEIWNVVNGKVESFWDDKQKILKQIALLENELKQSQKSIDWNKSKLLSVIKPENNPTLQSKITAIEKIIKRLSNWNEELAAKIRVEIESRNPQRIKDNISKLINYPVNDWGVEYIMSLEWWRHRALEWIKKIEQELNWKKELWEINTQDLGNILKNNESINSALSLYNKLIKRIADIKKEIQEKKDYIEWKTKDQIKQKEDHEKATKRIAELNQELTNLNKDFDIAKNKLAETLNKDSNQQLKSAIERNYKIIFTWVSFSSEVKKQEFLNALANKDMNYLSHFNIWESDIEYRRNLLWSIKKAEATIARIKQEIWLKWDSLWEINTSSLWKFISSNDAISKAIADYNKEAAKLNNINRQISSNKELLKIEKTISAIDFIANFIQVRADIWSSYSQNLRNKIYEWLEKYPDLVNIKVDWVKVNIAEQIKLFKTTKKWLIEVKPSSKIEISWPLMIDWEHQSTSEDKDRREKMNARTRMFFEFIVPQLYLPTELLEPWKDSSFRKDKFSRHQDNLKVLWVYDVRRWDTVEKVLKEQIIIYEKLDPADPKFQEKYNRFYALQIKALQLGWFLQDENTLNPWAFKINRVLPYYDSANISKLFWDYITQKKTIAKQTQESTKELKEFIDIKTYPWDVPSSIFNRIKEYVWTLENKFWKFPYLKIIKELNEYQQYLFLTQFLDQSIKTGSKSFNSWEFLRDIKPWKAFVLPLSDINNILKWIIGIHYYTWSPVYRKDVWIINLAAQTEQMRNLMRTVEFIEVHESIKQENSIFQRKNLKLWLEFVNRTTWISFAKSIWDFQIRINAISSWWTEWIKKENIEEFLAKLDSKEFKEGISNLSKSQQEKIWEDLLIADSIKKLISKPNMSKDDFASLKSYMVKLIRIDDWDMDNAVWKLLGAILLREKLNSHMQKLNWMLISSWTEPEDIYKDKDRMSEYEQAILLINHQWENNALYAFTENFLLRIIEKWFKTWVDTDAVFDESMKWKALWRIKYWQNTFISHIKSYIAQLEWKTKNPQDIAIFNKIKQFAVDFEKSDNKNQIIFDFMKDEELVKYLVDRWIHTSFIPRKDELTWGNFQKSVFNYLNKREKLAYQKYLQASR